MTPIYPNPVRKSYQPAGPAIFTAAGWQDKSQATGNVDRGYGCLVAVLLVTVAVCVLVAYFGF